MNQIVKPEKCYVFIPSTKCVGIAKFGERGYHPCYDGEYTQEYVDSLNEKLGLKPEEYRAMYICSMFNTWYKYEENVKMIRSKYENKKNS